jgi:hypothetical protein
VSAEQLLVGQSATSSFDALPVILETGYEVVVRDAAGRKTRGLSSIADDRAGHCAALAGFAGPNL